MRNVLLILATLGLVGGCSSAKTKIKNAVIANLIDPDSAKFGEITLNSRGDLACVTINAKNRMGGYTGDSEMLMARLESNGEWGKVSEYEDQTHEHCVEIIKQMPKD